MAQLLKPIHFPELEFRLKNPFQIFSNATKKATANTTNNVISGMLANQSLPAGAGDQTDKPSESSQEDKNSSQAIHSNHTVSGIGFNTRTEDYSSALWTHFDRWSNKPIIDYNHLNQTFSRMMSHIHHFNPLSSVTLLMLGLVNDFKTFVSFDHI
jgi:hypothetical protein